jgi:predicted O-linked N-acetylglucosamine transferase (SPINDLY family)
MNQGIIEIQNLLTETRQLHRSGDLVAAENGYQRILKKDQNDIEAIHGLGLLRHQQGNHSAALKLINKAAELDPANIRIKNNLGSVLLALGASQKAALVLQEAAILAPQDSSVLINLGLAERANEKLQRALDAFSAACRASPEDVGAWYHKAEQENLMGLFGEAFLSAQQVLTRYKFHIPTMFLLGTLHMTGKRLIEAVAVFEQIIDKLPDFHPALINLGILSENSEELEQAKGYYQRAIDINPGLSEAYFRLGAVLQNEGDLEGAKHAFERGQDGDPNNAEAWYVFGDILNRLGEVDAALSAYRQVLRLHPDDLAAQWRINFSLPIVYRTEDEVDSARKRYGNALDNWPAVNTLENEKGVKAAASVLSSYTNFYLPYQGRNDTAYQAKYGDTITRVANAAHPGVATLVGRQSGRRHIGFASANIHDHHTISKLFSGWMKHLDRKEFEVTIFYLGDKPESELQEIWKVSDGVITGWRGVAHMARIIQKTNLDCLIYPDIGMSPRVQLLAALRLAPMQCVAWGHPLTTGLQSIDYFLSSELMEPDGADAHYHEKLVRLPNLSIYYEQPDTSGMRPPMGYIEHGGLPTFLCSQSLYKLLPRFDQVYARIAKQMGACRILFIKCESKFATAVFEERLAKVFSEFGLRSADYCQFFPRLSRQEFLGLCSAADVILDSFLWSGGNTSLEAFACNRPIVTIPGPMMRGRHTAAMLRRMDIPELIASSIDEYIDVAVFLAKNKNALNKAGAKVAKRKALLYNDIDAVKALSEYLLEHTRVKSPRVST